MTSAQYQQTFDELVGQGYRLTWVSGYGHWGIGYSDEPLYTAIWEKRSGPEWVERHGLTPEQYQKAFDELVGQGYRLTQVSGYSANTQVMYAAIWEKRSGPEWVARHGLTSEQYQKAFDELVGQGYRLTQVSGYRVSNSTLNYAAIWEKNDGREWVARYDLTSAQYQQAFDELVGQGYRLTQVSGYDDDIRQEALYAAIWEKSDGREWVARHGLTPAQYQQAFDELVGQGYRLTQVSGYSVYGQPSMYYAAIWEKDSGSDIVGSGNSMTCANADTPAAQLSQEAAEEAVLCLINEQRVANGVPALKFNQKLRDAARLHANDAKTIRWWAGGGSKVHTNPLTGSTPQSRIKDAGYCPGEAAPPTNENCYDAYYKGGVQFQGGTTPRAAVTWWMNSQGHRNTLLNPIYSESGVGVVLGIAEKGNEADSADGGAIFVQTFGGCATPEGPNVG